MKALLATLLVLLSVQGANAAVVSREICAKIDMDFLENELDPTEDLNDYYLDDNDTLEPARYFYVHLNAPGHTQFAVLGVDGCITTNVHNDRSYVVSLYGIVRPGGTTPLAIAYPISTKSAPHQFASQPWAPTSQFPPMVVDVDINVQNSWTQMLLVWGHSLQDFWAHTSNQGNYIIHTIPNPTSGHSANMAFYDANGNPFSGGARVYLDRSDNFSALRKYVQAHELGHLVGFKANCELTANGCGLSDASEIDYGANDSGTPSRCVSSVSWTPISREFASAAAVEGWADYYAGRTFTYKNLLFGAPNGQRIKGLFWYPTVYVDGAYDLQGRNENGSLGGTEWFDGNLDSRDALGDVCSTGSDTNRGLAIDWARFFWDVEQTSRTLPGTSPTAQDMKDFWANMQSYNWCDSDPCPTGDSPGERAEASLSMLGYSSLWTAYKDNGVDY